MKHGSLITPDESQFGFGAVNAQPHAAASDGSFVTVPDAALLFNGEFKRAGSDLKIVGQDGESFLVSDYFKTEKRPTLLSPDGASLGAAVVEALAGPLAPGQYAQAGTPQSANPPIGRVEKVEGNATVVRNGVTITLNAGDVVLKGDVVQTGANSALGVVFADGTAFNLAANARMVLNDFVYDANSSNNSALISLVQGSISFVAGQVAKTGDMRVDTPVATMGIRGTAVLVEISANNGQTKFSVMVEPNGVVGSFNLYDKSTGALMATVNNSNIGWVVTPTGPLQAIAQQVQKTPGELQQELAIVQQVFQIYNQGQQNPFDPGSTPRPQQPTDPSNRGDNSNPQNTQTAQGTQFIPSGEIKITITQQSSGSGSSSSGSSSSSSSGGTGDDTSTSSDTSSDTTTTETTTTTTTFNIINGTDGDDTLTGTSGTDYVYAFGGTDLIEAGHGGGDDFYDGGAGLDTIGFPSADSSQPLVFHLYGISELNTVDGPATGHDVFTNIETIESGAGDDIFYIYQDDAWTIDGGDGVDTIRIVNALDLTEESGGTFAYNIEILDLNQGLENAVEITALDVLNANAQGALRLHVDSDDVVYLAESYSDDGIMVFGRWVSNGETTFSDGHSDGITFTVWQFFAGESQVAQATLYVQTDAEVEIIEPDYNDAPEISLAAATYLSFDGDDYARGPVATGNIGDGYDDGVTVEAWAKWDGSGLGAQTFFSHGNGSDAGFALFGEVSDGMMELRVLRGGFGIDSTGVSLEAGEWHHLAVTRECGTLKVYVDGELQFETDAAVNSIPGPSDNPDYEDYTLVGENLHGAVGELRVWEEARDCEDIAENMSRGLSGQEESLVGYWPFNEGQGDTVSDLAGCSENLTLFGEPEWITTGGEGWPREGLALNEDGEVTIRDITISDIDAGDADIEVTLTVGHGTLSLVDECMLSVESVDGGLKLTGSLADINAALAGGLVYQPDENFDGTDSISIYVDDLGNSGYGENQTAEAEFALFVTGLNDEPVTNAITPRGDEDTMIEVRLSGSDVEGDVTSFRITTFPENGTLYFDEDGENPVGENGLVEAGNNAATLYFRPNANWSGTTSLQYAAIDDEELQDQTPATATITVGSVNDAPVIDPTDAALTYVRQSNVYIDPNLGISDADDTQLNGVTIQISNGVQSGDTLKWHGYTGGSLTFVGGNTIYFAFNGSSHMMELWGGATVAQYQEFLREITLNNPSEDPTAGGTANSRTLTWIAFDGETYGAPATRTVNVVANNAPQTNSATPGGDEDTMIAVQLSGSDTDGTVASFRITSFPENGTLYFDEDGQDPVGENGLVEAGNNAATLYFRPDANWSGTTSLQYAAIDNDDLQDQTPATATINVAPVADTPTLEFDTSPVPAAEFTVNQQIDGDQYSTQLIPLSDGRVLFLWSGEDAPGDNDQSGISARIGTVAAGGQMSWGAEFKVNDATTGGQFSPSAAELADGRIVFTWTTAGAGDIRNIAGRIATIDQNGNASFGDEFGVAQLTSDIQNNARVIQLADGSLLFTWYSNDPLAPDTDSNRIAARVGILDSEGVITFADEFTVNQQTQSSQLIPDVITLEQGGVLFVWYSSDPDVDPSGYSGIAARMALFGPEGQVTFSDEIVISQNQGAFQNSPQVLQLSDGSLLFTWQSRYPTTQDSSDYSIVARHVAFDSEGDPVFNNEFTVNQRASGAQSNPRVIELADGRVVFTWDSNDTTVDGNSRGIAARIASFDGTDVLWEDEFTVDGNAGGIQARPQVIQLADGRLLFAWEGEDFATDGSGFGIAARIFTLPGQAPEGSDVILPAITASLADTDGSETLVLKLSGFPAGATFSFGEAGEGDDAGKWIIDDPDDISALSQVHLRMTPPQDYKGQFDLAIEAVATDADDSASSAYSVHVNVGNNQAPELIPTQPMRELVPGEPTPGMLAYRIAGVAITDNDAGDSPLRLTISADKGTLDTDYTEGLRILDGDDSDGVLQFEGMLDALNDMLYAGLLHTTPNEQDVIETISVFVDDQQGGTDTINFVFPLRNHVNLSLIEGTDGRDVMFGSDGSDGIAGGTGDDTFFFRASIGSLSMPNNDAIIDFDRGHDRIIISQLNMYGFTDLQPLLQEIDGDTFIRLTEFDALTIRGVTGMTEQDFGFVPLIGVPGGPFGN